MYKIHYISVVQAEAFVFNVKLIVRVKLIELNREITHQVLHSLSLIQQSLQLIKITCISNLISRKNNDGIVNCTAERYQLIFSEKF